MLMSRPLCSFFSILFGVLWEALRMRFLVPGFLAAVFLGGLSSGAQAQQVPFACDNTLYFNYVALSGDVYRWNRSSVPFTATHLHQFFAAHGGLAFNPEDRFLYTIRRQDATILILERMGADGVMDVGPLTGHNPGTSPDFLYGAFDSSGKYYGKNTALGVLFEVDVTSRAAISRPLIDSPGIGTAYGLAWHDERLYFIANATLYRINPGNGQVEIVGPIGLPAGAYALYGGIDGVYGYSDPNGSFYRFSTVDGHAEQVATLNGPSGLPEESKHGASCPTATLFRLTANLSITKTSPASSTGYVPGQQVQFEITVGNSGPNDVQNAVVTDTLPPGLNEDVIRAISARKD
jgi:uncharacterized repeat protein (TIGR01451 family)